MPEDDLYAKPLARIEPFAFNEQVAGVFQDMIDRSVPGYGLVVQLTGLIAEAFGQPGSRFYDLGASLGETTAALLGALPRDGEILALDKSLPMVHRMQKRFAHEPRVRVLQQDLLQAEFLPAQLAVMNFTLQFVPDPARPRLLERLAKALVPGGGLLLAEKIAMPDANAWHTRIHESYKCSRGYTRLEVAQKRAALEEVLVPNDLKMHEKRLLEAGFSQVIPWFQCLNFAALLAIR